MGPLDQTPTSRLVDLGQTSRELGRPEESAEPPVLNTFSPTRQVEIEATGRRTGKLLTMGGEPEPSTLGSTRDARRQSGLCPDARSLLIRGVRTVDEGLREDLRHQKAAVREGLT